MPEQLPGDGENSIMTLTPVKAHNRRPSAKATEQREKVRAMTDLMRRELALEAAMKRINAFHVDIGHRRRPAEDARFEPGISEGLL